ncbi:MAG: hypothetical protein WC028_22505 [Candidatus Obscuribacterales bacterium]|jgi:hypothetical protein
MSRKSDEIAARCAALGLKVIKNELPDSPLVALPSRPPSKLTVASVDGDSDGIEIRATTLAQWLEEQYHANVVPFHFLGDVPINVEDLPEEAVVDMAMALLRASGWQIQVQYFNSAGCRAGSVTMMHPDSVGF